jgi:hypothetical protein
LVEGGSVEAGVGVVRDERDEELEAVELPGTIAAEFEWLYTKL